MIYFYSIKTILLQLGKVDITVTVDFFNVCYQPLFYNGDLVCGDRCCKASITTVRYIIDLDRKKGFIIITLLFKQQMLRGEDSGTQSLISTMTLSFLEYIDGDIQWRILYGALALCRRLK